LFFLASSDDLETLPPDAEGSGAREDFSASETPAGFPRLEEFLERTKGDL
jgi:hypothetical protein